ERRFQAPRYLAPKNARLQPWPERGYPTLNPEASWVAYPLRLSKGGPLCAFFRFVLWTSVVLCPSFEFRVSSFALRCSSRSYLPIAQIRFSPDGPYIHQNVAWLCPVLPVPSSFRMSGLSCNSLWSHADPRSHPHPGR